MAEAPAARTEPQEPRCGHPVAHPHPGAVGLAKGYETVCCERMDVVQLKRSARGTHEKHDEFVGVQRDISRRLRRRARRAAGRASRRLRAPWSEVHRNPGEELVGILSGVRALHQRKPQEPSAIPVPKVRARRERRRERREEPSPHTARRRHTGPRSGRPGRSLLPGSAKPARTTQPGHRRQTGAAPRGGNGTPGRGRLRLPKGAPHPTTALALAAIVALDVFTKRNAGLARRSPDSGEAGLWVVCAGYALLANVSANLVIHRVLEDAALAPVFVPLRAIAAVYVLIVLGTCAAIVFRHGSPVRRVARWVAVVALVGGPFAMLAPGWWLPALIGSMAVAHGIDEMVRFAVRHPGATHRDLATCLVAASCVAPTLLVWRLGRWAIGIVGRETPASR